MTFRHSPSAPVPFLRRHLFIAHIILFGALTVILHPQILSLPFLNDDYIFLDKAIRHGFDSVLSRDSPTFHWYRPLSRELHYFVLHAIAGSRPLAFHLTSLVLWLTIIALYISVVRTLFGVRTSLTAALLLVTLHLWATPLLWAAGAQDLWMLVYSLLYLVVVLRNNIGLATLVLIVALLCKEAAAVLPVLGLACLVLFHHMSLRAALRRTMPMWLAVAAWILFHPTLIPLLTNQLGSGPEVRQQPAVAIGLLRTLLAQANLDALPRPELGWDSVLPHATIAAISALLVALCSYSLYPAAPVVPRLQAGQIHHGRYIAALWTLLGFLPTLSPMVGWHAYYGSLGTLGCWALLASLLASRQLISITLAVALAVLSVARAQTPSWDWATEWYQVRSGAILRSIKTRLFDLHPQVPSHSRLFFARIPNNIGLIAGDGPAIRVWYADTTLSGSYYSSYTSPQDPSITRDYFFRFDSVRVLVEIKTGHEDLTQAVALNPQWQHDHEVLAALFARNGGYAHAAAEYAKLFSFLPRRLDYAFYAAMAYEAAGDRTLAQHFYRVLRTSWGDSVVDARSRAFLGQISEQVHLDKK